MVQVVESKGKENFRDKLWCLAHRLHLQEVVGRSQRTPGSLTIWSDVGVAGKAELAMAKGERLEVHHRTILERLQIIVPKGSQIDISLGLIVPTFEITDLESFRTALGPDLELQILQRTVKDVLDRKAEAERRVEEKAEIARANVSLDVLVSKGVLWKNDDGTYTDVDPSENE